MQVSIIIPIYNVEKYIKECLKSVVTQGLTDYEILCIDDCGQDKSIDIVNEFKSQYNLNNLFIIKHDNNKGLSAARNTGIEHARGEYLFFLDSDDFLEKNSIYNLYNIAKNENLDVLEAKVLEFFDEIDYKIHLGNSSIDYETSILDGDSYFSEVNKNNHYMPMACGKLYRTIFIKNNFRFFPDILSEDEEFTPRVLLKAERVKYVNIPTYYYRRRNESITTSFNKSLRWVDSYIIIIRGLQDLERKNKFKASSKYLNRRAAQMTLSLLKNAVAYNLSKEYVKEIIKVIRKEKLYLDPIKSSFIKERLEGIVFVLPHLYMFLYKLQLKARRGGKI